MALPSTLPLHGPGSSFSFYADLRHDTRLIVFLAVTCACYVTRLMRSLTLCCLLQEYTTTKATGQHDVF
jgi:hypothetical protein